MIEEQKKKKKIKYKVILAGIIMALLLMMPVCYIQSIEVKNNFFYTAEEIIQTSGIGKGHVLDLSYLTAKKHLKKLNYIADVKLNYEFPGKIIIDVTEKAPYAYVKFKGNFLCINEQGQVIEQSQEKYHEIPIISGIKFKEFKVGEALPILNEDHWFVAQEVMEKLMKYDYATKINEIDVHNIEEIHLYVDKLDVIMGDIGDFDKKIVLLIQTYEGNDINLSVGELDISGLSKTGYATLKQNT